MTAQHGKTPLPRFRRTVRRAVAGAVALALSGCASNPLAGHAINKISEGWYTWGNVKTEVVSDPAAPGGKFQRVAVQAKPANPWEAGVVVTLTKPVKKGDVIVFAFWARADVLPQGNDFIDLAGHVGESGPSPVAITPEAGFLLSKKWKLFHSSGTVERDIPGGKAGGSIVLGADVQTIDFGPVYISDFGPGFDVSKLWQLKAADR